LANRTQFFQCQTQIAQRFFNSTTKLKKSNPLFALLQDAAHSEKFQPEWGSKIDGGEPLLDWGYRQYLLRRILVQQPVRFKLGGRPVLNAYLNVETAGFERKRPEI